MRMDKVDQLMEIQRLYNCKQYNKALELIESYSTNTSEYNSFLAWKALCVFRIGDHDEARGLIDKILKQNPKQKDAIRVRGIFKSEANDHEGAIKDFNEAILLDSKFALAYHSRGREYDDIGNQDAAIHDFDVAIRLDPQYTSSFLSRGNAYFAKGDLSDAIRDYNEVIRLDPNDESAFHNRGLAYLNKGDVNAAIRDFTEAIRLDPKMTFAFVNRGLVYYDKKEMDFAIRDFNTAINLDPKNSTAYFNRGLVFLEKDERASAIRDFQEVIKINPKHKDSLINLAYLYKEEGNISGYLLARSSINQIELIKGNTVDPNYQFLSDCVYSTILNRLLPQFHSEKLIDYWLVQMEWGNQTRQSLIYDGNSSYVHQARFGLGFVAITNKSIWIVSLGDPSRKLLKGNGIFKKGFLMLLRNFDFSGVEKEDKFFQFPYQHISNLQKCENGIILKTDIETWTLASDDPMLYPALSLALEDRIDEIFLSTPPSLPAIMAPPPLYPNQDIFTQIEKLKNLLDLGAITQQEFDEKKKELLLKI